MTFSFQLGLGTIAEVRKDSETRGMQFLRLEPCRSVFWSWSWCFLILASKHLPIFLPLCPYLNYQAPRASVLQPLLTSTIQMKSLNLLANHIWLVVSPLGTQDCLSPRPCRLLPFRLLLSFSFFVTWPTSQQSMLESLFILTNKVPGDLLPATRYKNPLTANRSQITTTRVTLPWTIGTHTYTSM